MKRIILITGGARSGKSSYAQKLAEQYGKHPVYLATAVPFDDEMKERIRKHKEVRSEKWKTIEAYKDLDIVLSENIQGRDVVLVDCITVMLTNIMMDIFSNWDNISIKEADLFERAAETEVKKLMEYAKKSEIPFIIVTNETGMGIMPAYRSARVFCDAAGRINGMMAEYADEVYMCVCRMPIKLKGKNFKN